MPVPVLGTTLREIWLAKRELDQARAAGDPLRVELAEDGLNDLLDRLGRFYNEEG